MGKLKTLLGLILAVVLLAGLISGASESEFEDVFIYGTVSFNLSPNSSGMYNLSRLETANLSGIAGADLNLESNFDATGFNITLDGLIAAWVDIAGNLTVGNFTSPDSANWTLAANWTINRQSFWEGVVSAADANFSYIYDYVLSNDDGWNNTEIWVTGNASGWDAVSVAFIGNGSNWDNNVSDWTNLQNYPAACPGGTSITTIGDTVICTAPTAADIDPATYPDGNYSYPGNVSIFNLSVDGAFIGPDTTIGNCSVQDSCSPTVLYSENATAQFANQTESFTIDYLYAHSNSNITVDSAGAWYNVSFDEEETAIKRGITHTHSDNTNSTFIILDSGIYEVNFHVSFEDSAASPAAAVAVRVTANETEIVGSLTEHDTSKQNDDLVIGHTLLANFTQGDVIRLSFTASATTVTLSSHGTFGDNIDSASFEISRVG